MNFISRLISRARSEKSLIAVTPGEFSIVRQEDSPKGQRELIFKEAKLCLTSTTREFFVQIQVRDLNNDAVKKSTDDGELSEFDNDDDNTYTVHTDLKLGYYLKSGRVAITWQDLEGDTGDRFEFLCADSVPKEALDRFDRTVNEALYGQKYGKAAPKDAEESLFEEFNHEYDEHGLVKIKDDDARVVSDVREYSEGRLMMSMACDLCIYDFKRGAYVSPPQIRDAHAVVIDQGDYMYFLEVRKLGNAILGTPVHEDLNLYVDLSNCSLVFNYEFSKDMVVSYLLRFTDQKSVNTFEQALSMAIYENKNHKRWDDVPEDEQDYLSQAINGMDIDEETDGDGDEEADEEADEIFDDEELDANAGPNSKGEKNSALEVGHTNDRTFVVRGNKIGIFKSTVHSLQYSTTIEGLSIDPERIMLHEQDRTLIMHAKNDPNKLYRMDLESGKIVDKWDIGREIIDFSPVAKFAPTTAEQNLVGVAKQSLFRIDPRVNGGAVSSDSEKAYKTKKCLNLSQIATSESGWLVVGNARGELRLYDRLGRNATTLIPGLGDPFIGLDITSDGKYVLATCERYILLLETVTSDNNGFTKVWSKESRPMPRKLHISPENAAYMRMQTKKPITFTPAKFNTSVDGKETSIISSTGPYLVTWSLRGVLRGEPNSYRIKVYNSTITAESFKFDTDQRVVLTLENDVNMVAKSALKSPNVVFKQSK